MRKVISEYARFVERPPKDLTPIEQWFWKTYGKRPSALELNQARQFIKTGFGKKLYEGDGEEDDKNPV